MEVTDRVHVVALGWEVARIVEPLYDLKADKVVLICPDNEALIAEFEAEMRADLEAMDRIEVETRMANLYDLDSALQVFTQAVTDHGGDDVYINVSTGSKIAAIAGMMATQTTEATPFYVRPTRGGAEETAVEPPDEPVVSGAGAITELPVFELQGPSSEQLRILAFLHGKDGVTKKELIQYTESQSLPFIANTESKSEEGRYKLLESHIITPLTDGEYISVEKVGREKQVFLEDRGVDALAAFPLEADTLEAVESSGDETYIEDFYADAFSDTAHLETS
ncbi:hypothetical protein EGH24_00440 [Halonotius terrestris]|uniref:Uncharacterized protein n=1 Tax=Halonotius terrestris TaxID=2487750 RepID=A0A8J8TDH6_9EURY|nr:DUF6293 family protein [Halonotius terrestris]TQQ83307.1 hypothetical protein EGH24_00440 [Halonotius terrestris]